MTVFAIETSSGSRNGVFFGVKQPDWQQGGFRDPEKKRSGSGCCILGVSQWLLKSGMVMKAWVAKALAASRVLFLPAAAAICLLNFNLSVGAISTAWILQVLK